MRTPSNPLTMVVGWIGYTFARTPPVAVLKIAERVVFTAHNNPGLKGEEIAAHLTIRPTSAKSPQFSRESFHLMLFSDPSAVERLKLSRLFLLGLVLLVVGATMRQVCSNTLGKFFTVFKGHKLVAWCLYSLVHHSSYTTFLIARTRLFIVQIFQVSYVFESRLLDTWWTAVAIGVWEVWILPIVFEIVIMRIQREDTCLSRTRDVYHYRSGLDV